MWNARLELTNNIKINDIVLLENREAIKEELYLETTCRKEFSLEQWNVLPELPELFILFFPLLSLLLFSNILVSIPAFIVKCCYN